MSPAGRLSRSWQASGRWHGRSAAARLVGGGQLFTRDLVPSTCASSDVSALTISSQLKVLSRFLDGCKALSIVNNVSKKRHLCFQYVIPCGRTTEIDLPSRPFLEAIDRRTCLDALQFRTNAPGPLPDPLRRVCRMAGLAVLLKIVLPTLNALSLFGSSSRSRESPVMFAQLPCPCRLSVCAWLHGAPGLWP